MSNRISVGFSSEALSGLDNTITSSTEFTDYQTSMMLQALLLLKLRYLWEDMTDEKWDELSGNIADVIQKVSLFG